MHIGIRWRSMPLHRVFVINSHCSRIQKSEFGSDNRARMFLGFYIRPLRWIQSPSRYVIFIVTSFGLQEFSSNGKMDWSKNGHLPFRRGDQTRGDQTRHESLASFNLSPMLLLLFSYSTLSSSLILS